MGLAGRALCSADPLCKCNGDRPGPRGCTTRDTHLRWRAPCSARLRRSTTSAWHTRRAAPPRPPSSSCLRTESAAGDAGAALPCAPCASFMPLSPCGPGRTCTIAPPPPSQVQTTPTVNTPVLREARAGPRFRGTLRSAEVPLAGLVTLRRRTDVRWGVHKSRVAWSGHSPSNNDGTGGPQRLQERGWGPVVPGGRRGRGGVLCCQPPAKGALSSPGACAVLWSHGGTPSGGPPKHPLGRPPTANDIMAPSKRISDAAPRPWTPPPHACVSTLSNSRAIAWDRTGWGGVSASGHPRAVCGGHSGVGAGCGAQGESGL